MDDKKLERALKLKEEINTLDKFLDHMINPYTKGELKVVGFKAWLKFKVGNWEKSEMTLELDKDLVKDIWALISNKLARLEDEYEKL